MPLGTPVYPTTLDTDATIGPTSGIVAGTTPLGATGSGQGDLLGITRNLINQVVALQTKLGINASADTASLDYLAKHVPYARFTAFNSQPPAANYPSLGSRNAIPILSFPQSVDTYTDFMSDMPLA